MTDVRSRTITLRKQTFDPHKLDCGATTTFLPLQLSPPVEHRSPLHQTELTADAIAHSDWEKWSWTGGGSISSSQEENIYLK